MKINTAKIRSLVCVLMLMLGLWTLPTQADQSYGYHYHYTSFSEVPLPPGFVEFQPGAIDDMGRVYGTVFNANASFPHYAAVYENDVIRVLQPGEIFAPSANARGTVGGSVFDSQTGTYQAALFRGDQVDTIPSTDSSVQSLNDSDTALLWSPDPSGQSRNIYWLYNKGKTIFSFQLPTGADCWLCWGVNNQGIVSGTLFSLPDFNDASRAIRFIPPYDNPQLLDPLPGDISSNSYGINSSGNVLVQTT